jgi:prepilin-type N-terminal cleavage/methylation domain-containing protein
MTPPSRHQVIGFTLIELLVVIAVIVILAALLLPVLSSAREKGCRVACINNNKQLTTALHLYADDNGDWLPWPNWGNDYGPGWLYMPTNGHAPNLLDSSEAAAAEAGLYGLTSSRAAPISARSIKPMTLPLLPGSPTSPATR